jgi:hypothetical protein
MKDPNQESVPEPDPQPSDQPGSEKNPCGSTTQYNRVPEFFSNLFCFYKVFIQTLKMVIRNPDPLKIII